MSEHKCVYTDLFMAISKGADRTTSKKSTHPSDWQKSGEEHIHFKEHQSTLPTRQFQGRRLGTGNVAICGRRVTWVQICPLGVVDGSGDLLHQIAVVSLLRSHIMHG